MFWFVGYESEAAFNRAVKKQLGVPPGTWRRARFADGAPKPLPPEAVYSPAQSAPTASASTMHISPS